MLIGHRDATDDGSNNTDEALIGSAKKEVRKVGSSVELFLCCAIDGTVVMRCEASDRFWSEDISFSLANNPSDPMRSSDRNERSSFVE
jgi:hypothetical protein